MSMEALSGDIFSILRKFTSPRMGQFDNTNAPRPMPPKGKAAADSDAARVMSDPTRYGATGSDAGTGLVPQPPGPSQQLPMPQPVARRVVPAGAPRPAPVAGDVQQPPPLPAPSSAVGRLTGDVEATGAVQPPPPGDGSRATALVNAPDGPADTGAAPGGGGEFDFILNNPIYKFQKLQQQRLYAENERQQRMDNLVGGFGRIIGAATGAGGGDVKVRGDISSEPTLTYEHLKDLAAQQSEVIKQGNIRKVADVIARRYGMDRAALEGMILTHPEDFSKVNFNLVDAKSLADAEKAVADVIKTQEETKKIAGVDTEKAKADIVQSQASAEASRAAAESSRANAEKTRTVDTELARTNAIQSLAAAKASEAQAGKTGQEMISPDILSDEQLIEIARSANKPTTPAYIQTLRSLGTAGVSKLLIDTATQAAGVAQPHAWQGDEIKARQVERQKLELSTSQLPQLAYLRSLLDDKRGGSITSDAVQSVKREIGYILGIDTTTMNTEQYNAAIQGPVQKVLKTYGSNASTPDLQAASKSFGEGLNPETAKQQLAFLAKTKIWDIVAHNKEVERMASHMTESNAAGQRAQKYSLPPPDEGTLNLTGIPPMSVQTLQSVKGTPKEAEARAAFERNFGKNMAEWVLGEL